MTNAIAKKIAAAGLLALALAGSADARPYGHHFHHGYHPGAGLVVAGALGALAFGALAADNCYVERRPVTDRWGNVIYLRDVRVCD